MQKHIAIKLFVWLCKTFKSNCTWLSCILLLCSYKCSFITIGHWNPPCELIARVLLACVIISKITSGTLFLYSSCYLLHCKLIFTWWDFEVDLSHIMFQHSYFILCLIGSILSPYRESQFWFCSPLLFAGQGHMEVPLVCWPFILVIIVCKPVIFVIIKVRD